MSYVDPISYFQIICMHIGGRFLKFDVTPALEKILQSKVTRAIIFYSFTTTDISIELFLRFSYYITLYVIIFSVIGLIILKILNKEINPIIEKTST